LLQRLSSYQLGEWMAFAQIEQVGEAPPPDPEETAKAERQKARAKVEGGLRALMDKQQRAGIK